MTSLPNKTALKRRFDQLIRVTPGCWFSKNSKGRYPLMEVAGKNWTMSRVAYEVYVGSTHEVSRDGGKEICHSCDNPHCVNPDHLFIGTHTENMADMRRKGREHFFRGTAHPAAKLDEQKVRLILSDSRTQRQIAREYGINQATVSHIKNRKIWRHVNV